VRADAPASIDLLFDKPFRIGRVDDCEVTIKNDYVSRSHAEVFFQDGGWWVKDLASSNGIFVQGQRVELAPWVSKDLSWS
jgi:pSer/pThr/pTyr-binding forkhead associated (FHA) protein